MNSCSPGPGSAWKHGIYSGPQKEGGATLGTARRFMNDKKLSASDASLNQSIVESVGDKYFYEEDHARPGPGQYTIPTTMGPYPDSKMRSVVVPLHGGHAGDEAAEAHAGALRLRRAVDDGAAADINKEIGAWVSRGPPRQRAFDQ